MSATHHENCDVNDINPDGIKKPCNCGAEHSLPAPDGSTAERIAMKALLHQWLNKGVKTFSMPGAWEYDKEAAELVETTAELLGIERPWTRR